MPTTEETLRRVALFAGLDERELGQVAESVTERRVEAGSEVVTEGKGGIEFFVILEGEGEGSVGGPGRRALAPGDHFGESALFVPDELRTATVTARTDLRV